MCLPQRHPQCHPQQQQLQNTQQKKQYLCIRCAYLKGVLNTILSNNNHKSNNKQYLCIRCAYLKGVLNAILRNNNHKLHNKTNGTYASDVPIWKVSSIPSSSITVINYTTKQTVPMQQMCLPQRRPQHHPQHITLTNQTNNICSLDVPTSKASSMPSSVTFSLSSLACSTASALYFRMNKDSSVAMHTSSPFSLQKIWTQQGSTLYLG